MSLLNDLDRLLAEIEHPEDVEELKSVRADLKRAVVQHDLLKHAGINLLVKYYSEQRKFINEVLLENREINDAQRATLFARRDWIDDLIGFFDVKQAKAAAKAVVDNEKGTV